jgi:hypothetical protein
MAKAARVEDVPVLGSPVGNIIPVKLGYNELGNNEHLVIMNKTFSPK